MINDLTTLTNAIAHLRDFRETLYDGDEVDETSHLRTADLDIVLAAAERQLQADRRLPAAEAGASGRLDT